MKRSISILAVATGLWQASCTGPPATQPQATPPAAAATNRIDIPPTVRDNLGITFARVQRRRVADTIRIPGAFELLPSARREYRMTLPGRVELLATQFQPVEPGTPLYRFRSQAWHVLQGEILEAERAIDAAVSDIDLARARRDEAREQRAIMQTRLEALARADVRRADLEAEAVQLRASLPRLDAELRRAEVSLDAARVTREQAIRTASAASGIPETQLLAEVRRAGTLLPGYRAIDSIEVEATQSGVVELLAVTNGAFVEPPALVVSTVDPTRLRFRAMALQSDLPRLAGHASARIAPPTTPGLEIGDGVPAGLTIGPDADPGERTITVIADVGEARPWILPGVWAFLEVVVESTGSPALAIPRSAIVKDGIVHVFFRRDPEDPNKAIRVEADMGTSDGRWVAIRSGLMLDDEVVLDGAYELKLASQQHGGPPKGGHVHADGTTHADH